MFNQNRIRPCLTPLLLKRVGLSIDRDHKGHKKKQIMLFLFPNDFWHLLNSPLQPASLLTMFAPVLLVARPSGHHLVSSLQQLMVWCSSPLCDSDRVQAYRACLLLVRGVCYNLPEYNCYESHWIWFTVYASVLTEFTCLCSHVHSSPQWGETLDVLVVFVPPTSSFMFTPEGKCWAFSPL